MSEELAEITQEQWGDSRFLMWGSWSFALSLAHMVFWHHGHAIVANAALVGAGLILGYLTAEVITDYTGGDS